jgi:predicted HicB family RNase H-like nuclease
LTPKPRTPARAFRIPEKLYRAAQAKAREQDETLTHVVRRALEKYVEEK